MVRQWRTRRGLTLGALALKTGANKSTLSRWEAGKRQPSTPELEAVLDALGVSDGQRTEAWERINAPRALHRLRDLTPEGPPASGDLLRAMRLRTRRTQEETARRVGVAQSAVARWERGESWPSPERLQALCFALGAREEEMAALTGGRLVLLPSHAVPVSPADLADEIWRLRDATTAGEYELMDLRFLSLEARLWPLARQELPGRQCLALAYTVHARWLAFWGREEECDRYVRASLALSQEALPKEPYWLWTVHLLAQGPAYRKSPAKAAGLLREWLPVAARWPRFENWFRLTIAGFLGAGGEIDGALEQSARAREGISRLGPPMRHANLGRAKALLRAGLPWDAIALLPTERDPVPVGRVDEALVWTEALVKVGDSAAAQEWLECAYGAINEGGLERHRARADRLARRL